MRRGRLTIFLSCSHKYLKTVAVPIRDALDPEIDAVIAELEPPPPNTEWDPETKIERLLDQSDAVIVLATPDDTTAQGENHIRPNVVDEMGRARSRSDLRNHIAVFKEPSVTLHSNINPVHEPLSLDDPTSIVNAVIGYLRSWDLLPANPNGQSSSSEARPREPVEPDDESSAGISSVRQFALTLLDGLKLADWDDAGRRAYHLAYGYRREFVGMVATDIANFAMEDRGEDDDAVHPAVMLLEVIYKLDHSEIRDTSKLDLTLRQIDQALWAADGDTWLAVSPG